MQLRAKKLTYQGWGLQNKELKPCTMMHVWAMLPKAPGKEELQGRAAPRQPAQLPGDSGTAAAKAGQSPLEMSATTSGGCPGELPSVSLCTNTTHPHHQGEGFKNPNPFIYRVLKGTRKMPFNSLTGNMAQGKAARSDGSSATSNASAGIYQLLHADDTHHTGSGTRSPANQIPDNRAVEGLCTTWMKDLYHVLPETVVKTRHRHWAPQPKARTSFEVLLEHAAIPKVRLAAVRVGSATSAGHVTRQPALLPAQKALGASATRELLELHCNQKTDL